MTDSTHPPPPPGSSIRMNHLSLAERERERAGNGGNKVGKINERAAAAAAVVSQGKDGRSKN